MATAFLALGLIVGSLPRVSVVHAAGGKVQKVIFMGDSASVYGDAISISCVPGSNGAECYVL